LDLTKVLKLKKVFQILNFSINLGKT